MAPIKWRIQLFGSLCLLKGNQIVHTFPPSKVGELLAYLACHANRVYTRQELAERFWPETDNSTGRTRLRQHLTVLRRQLEPDEVAPGSVLRTNRDEISLDPSSFTTDRADFENALRDAEQTDDADERMAHLKRVLTFYRGELLSGYHEHWIMAERERLKERVSGALRELASACERANDLARSIDYLQRLVSVDPLREESHFALIRLLITAHQPGAARRQYKTLERLLKTEWEETPSKETRALIAGLPAEENAPANGPAVPGVYAPNASYALLLTETSASDSAQDSTASQDMLETQEAHLSPAFPVPAPASSRLHRSHRLTSAGISLMLLLILSFLSQRWFETMHRSAASRNYSPAVKKNGDQGELWIARYETKPGDKDSQPTAMTIDKEGNIYVTGFIDTVATDVDYLTLKYAPDGTLLWENRYNGTGNDVDRAYSIAVDADGSTYVTGESYGLSGSGTEEHKEMDIVTVKYDKNGNQVRVDRYDGPGHGGDTPASVQVDGRGHVYVFGTDWNGELKDGHEGHRCVLIQYDTNLNRNWIKTCHDPNGGEVGGKAMLIDPEGFIYVTGSGNKGFVTLKYDAYGNQLWIKAIPWIQNIVSLPIHLLRDEHSNLYVVCQVVKRTQCPPQETYAMQVLKYDSNGQIQWDHTYWHAEHSFRGTDAAKDGKIYITGTAYDSINRMSQGLLVIREDGSEFAYRPISSAPRGDQQGNSMAIDHRQFLHITGLSHFEDPAEASPYLDTTEMTTETYSLLAGLYRVHRYAGSDILRSIGGRAIAVDHQDNVIVAGQTFCGKTNDLVVIKYPP